MTTVNSGTGSTITQAGYFPRPQLSTHIAQSFNSGTMTNAPLEPSSSITSSNVSPQKASFGKPQAYLPAEVENAKLRSETKKNHEHIQPLFGEDSAEAALISKNRNQACQFSNESSKPVLALAEAIQRTLEGNPDLQSAVERTRMADETLARARADFFPVLALNESYHATNNGALKVFYLEEQGGFNPFVGLPRTVDNLHTQVHLQQDLFRGGKRLAGTRGAEAERQASFFRLATVQNRIVFQVAEAYYRLFQARELVKVQREAVYQVESELKVVQARFGHASASETLDADAHLWPDSEDRTRAAVDAVLGEGNDVLAEESRGLTAD